MYVLGTGRGSEQVPRSKIIYFNRILVSSLQRMTYISYVFSKEAVLRSVSLMGTFFTGVDRT